MKGRSEVILHCRRLFPCPVLSASKTKTDDCYINLLGHRDILFFLSTQRTGQLSLKKENNLEMLVFTFLAYLKQKVDN